MTSMGFHGRNYSSAKNTKKSIFTNYLSIVKKSQNGNCYLDYEELLVFVGQSSNNCPILLSITSNNQQSYNQKCNFEQKYTIFRKMMETKNVHFGPNVLIFYSKIRDSIVSGHFYRHHWALQSFSTIIVHYFFLLFWSFSNILQYFSSFLIIFHHFWSKLAIFGHFLVRLMKGQIIDLENNTLVTNVWLSGTDFGSISFQNDKKSGADFGILLQLFAGTMPMVTTLK